MLITNSGAADLARILSMLPLGEVVAVDTETTGLHMYEDDVLRGISLAFEYAGGTVSVYIPVGYPEGNLSDHNIELIFSTLKEREPFLVLHHGKFDFAFLRQLPRDSNGGVYFPFPEPHRWWDTKVVSWLLDENMPTGLKENAAFYWGDQERDEQESLPGSTRTKKGKISTRKVDWAKLSLDDIAPYAAKDAELTLRLYHRQKAIIAERAPVTLGDIQPAIERELAIQGVLYRMEQTGILVNPELIEKMRGDTQRTTEMIEASFTDCHGVNINSTKQLSEFLYNDPDFAPRPGLGLTAPGKTPGGKPATNRAALEQLESQHSLVAELMKHRRLKKALSGYLQPLGDRIGYDGRIHPSFSSTGTVSGRFSCSSPNLQTIPRADTLPGVRDIFIAEDGHVLLELDLQAAEMRVVAGMAGEQFLIDALNDGIDMHGALAAQVFGDSFTGIQRRYAKNLGYGWFYGLTNVKTAAKYISGEDGERIAKRILDGLKKLYPKVYRMMGRESRRAAREGIIPINADAWPGRFRHFQTPGRPAFAYTSLNAQVQGTIAEIMKDVMLAAEYQLGAIGARLCLQVHDSLVIETPIGTTEKVRAVLQAAVDDVNPCEMPMIFDCHEWAEHD